MRFTIDQDFDFSVVINDFSFLIVVLFFLVIRSGKNSIIVGPLPLEAMLADTG